LSLIVAAILVGGGALAVGVATRFRRNKQVAPAPTPDAPAPDGARSTPLAALGFDVELGDVVEIAGRELWLERGWLLTEAGDAVAAVFGAAEATLIVLPSPARRVYVLDEVEVALPADPPATLESKGVRFERARRIPVEIDALGKSPPLPWDQAVLAEYRGLGGDALWLLGARGRAKAWQGRLCNDSEIERWGGGSGTLE
jgi:hypothetical protein